MNGFLNLVLKVGPTRLFAALTIVAISAAFLFTFVLRMGGEGKALLFAGVETREAAEITQRLEAAHIPYEIRGDGSSIFVPRSRVHEARMMLSADGLPSRGSIGDEIFDEPDALGQTQFQQNINRLRALEDELARTIASLDGIDSARVHLVLPERQLFQREAEQPSASIVLRLRRDETEPGTGARDPQSRRQRHPGADHQSGHDRGRNRPIARCSVRLMQLYAWSGQFAAALRQYQECARILEQGIGVGPDTETVELYEAIKSRRIEPPENQPILQRGTASAYPSEQQICYCQSRDGVTLAYATVGDGPTLVKVANWLSHLEFDCKAQSGGTGSWDWHKTTPWYVTMSAVVQGYPIGM